MVHAQVEESSAPAAVLAYADEQDVDLIVMGTHGRRGLDRFFIGSVAEEVMRLATTPVLTVHSEGSRGADHVERILVPVDFSEHSKLSVTYARELAATYGARIDLLHVVEDVTLPTVYGLDPYPLGAPEVLGRIENGLMTMIEEAPGADVPIEAHVRNGHPIRDIIAFAEERDTDLIVIATHGLSGVRRLLMGSVSERIVRAAPCPVFTVKSFGKQLVRDLQPVVAGEH
jgi:nucleotide-binding universal stress UspA family protein